MNAPNINESSKSNQKYHLLLIFFLLHFSFHLSARPKWEDPHWIKLLHYKKNLWGKFVSEADGQEFFLSPTGKWSPEDEFHALIESLKQQESDENKNIHCRFPARLRWLKKQGIPLELNSIECKELNFFRQQVSARSVAVVFSSYYLDNPISSFGHTFIRLGKSQTSQLSNELLDTGVNFSAQTGSANVFEYVVKGLGGGFRGEFRAVPYYFKVHEYNDWEQRDLWSYELSLRQEEIDFLVDHLWELKQNHFDYYFLTENCSYHILSLIEAAKPELDLTDKTSRFFVIPAETLKILAQENLINFLTLRPSPARLSQRLIRALSPEKRKLVPLVIKEPSLAKKFDDIYAASLLDAALSSFEIQNQQDIREKKADLISQRNRLLLTRAQIPVSSKRPGFDDLLKNAPHDGHGPVRFSLGSLRRDNKSWVSLGLRPAQHDILDDETSYLPKTSFEIFNILARTDGKTLELEEALLLNLMILKDITDPGRPLSWKFKSGAWRESFKTFEIHEFGFAGGIGISKFFRHVSPYFFIQAESVFENQRRLFKTVPGIDLGLLLNLSKRLKVNSTLGMRDNRYNESYLLNEIRLTNKRYGFGLKGVYFPQSKQQEHHINVFAYF